MIRKEHHQQDNEQVLHGSARPNRADGPGYGRPARVPLERDHPDCWKDRLCAQCTERLGQTDRGKQRPIMH